MNLLVAGLALLTAVSAAQTPETALRRVEVHLFGGDMTAGAPLAQWYHDIGITDLWLYPFRGAFPQDQRPEDQKTPEQVAELLAAYRQHHLRCWWMERPVPDVFYQEARGEGRHLWDASPEAEALWAGVCEQIRAIYPRVKGAGFRGVVYDNESYYSYQGDEQGDQKPWVWGGHAAEYGTGGHYYQRGLQVGKAIRAAWPEAAVVMVYAFGYEGERWWYQGFQDAGVELFLGPEHTYGAGPPELGEAWYQSWWQGRDLKATCDWKCTQFPFVADNAHVMAGLFPIEFTTLRPNYRARYFREQLSQAANGDPAGPIPVWIWPQGPFSPESWQAVQYAGTDTAGSYLQALCEFSAAGTR
ncbi:MAG: hypothetical protein WDA75_22190 [Candidatus Latescibacterota bacterium]